MYSSVESPYNGIQLIGRDISNAETVRINLPIYISKLIHSDNVNIQVTPIGAYANYFVNNINIEYNYFNVSRNDYDYKTYEFFWMLTGERKDVDKLISEQ